jgi:hypothetical protein
MANGRYTKVWHATLQHSLLRLYFVVDKPEIWQCLALPQLDMNM